MFELSVARKYLIPSVRQFSVSCISLISIFVIALVSWLSVVFFSAQESIEKKWTEKMVAVTAPIRLIPTTNYYKSPYYQIDAYSQKANFSHKSLLQKLKSDQTDPYDPESDPPLPFIYSEPLVDIVKKTAQVIESNTPYTVSAFETVQGEVKVFIENATITQNVLFTPFDPNNRFLIDFSSKKEGIILPKNFKEAGAATSNRVIISTQGFGALSTKKLKRETTVIGFYDPGIIPLGGKIIFVTDALFSELEGASLDDSILPSGLNIQGVDLKKTKEAKNRIYKLLQDEKLDPYFTIETFSEYPFTKDIFQQMQSDKNLFLLIALIIIVVAASNIMSMLIILVHDKRKEIAIMQALGARKKNIALIFGLCGFFMGILGAIIGIIAGIITLKNLNVLLQFLSKIQGFDVLNQAFYGQEVSAEISLFALLFVLIATTVISTIAGTVSSIMATKTNTSEALKV